MQETKADLQYNSDTWRRGLRST